MLVGNFKHNQVPTVFIVIINIFLLIVVFMLVGNFKHNQVKESIRQDIVRFLYHEQNNYSVFIMKEDKSIKIIHLDSNDFRGVHNFAKIICDAPTDKPMWYEGIQRTSWGSTAWDWLEIHIHSAADINGGGWNHGKFGKGQTIVVE